MTDEPVPAPSDPTAPAERARIEAPARRRWDALPLLYLVGFVVLAGALFYLYQNPPEARLAPQEAGRVETLQDQLRQLRTEVAQLQGKDTGQGDVTKLQDRVAALESRPTAAAPATADTTSAERAPQSDAQPSPDLSALTGRVDALEKREVPDFGALSARIDALEKRPAPDLGPLAARIDALEKRPAPDLGPLAARIDGLEQRPPVDLGPLSSRIDQLGAQERDALAAIGKRLDTVDARIGTVDAEAKQTAAALDAINQRAQRAAKLQIASAALVAGQKLPDIPGAPPALSRFSSEPPPTEASLRLSFDRYADAAQRASQPAIMDNQDFGTRLWNRAQQVVTVRQGDRVLLGDPIAGVLSHAREALDAGDLVGAVKALDGLAGPAAQAMKPWADQVRALLDARAAIASMAAG